MNVFSGFLHSAPAKLFFPSHAVGEEKLIHEGSIGNPWVSGKSFGMRPSRSGNHVRSGPDRRLPTQGLFRVSVVKYMPLMRLV